MKIMEFDLNQNKKEQTNMKAHSLNQPLTVYLVELYWLLCGIVYKKSKINYANIIRSK